MGQDCIKEVFMKIKDGYGGRSKASFVLTKYNPHPGIQPASHHSPIICLYKHISLNSINSDQDFAAPKLEKQRLSSTEFCRKKRIVTFRTEPICL